MRCQPKQWALVRAELSATNGQHLTARCVGKVWLYINERVACRLGNRLVADHPKIAEHLQTRAPKAKISTIAYGADKVEKADFGLLSALDIKPDKYAVVIARPERDNSFLEIITAFSRKNVAASWWCWAT